VKEFSLYSVGLVFRMRELGVNEALLVKQVWLELGLALAGCHYRGERNTTHYPSVILFQYSGEKGGMPGVLYT
jgi:hypothetical protein